jgi:hypothetical protein
MTGDQFDHNLRRVVHDFADLEPPLALEEWLGDLLARATPLPRSRTTFVRPLAAAAAVLVVIALGFSVYWARSGSAGSGALPSGQPLTIVTESVSRPGAPCQLARFAGGEMRRSGSEVLFSSYDGSDVTITWPYGTTALLVNGQAELFAQDGTLIATEGQTLPDLGGGLGVDERFHVCEIGGRTY